MNRVVYCKVWTWNVVLYVLQFEDPRERGRPQQAWTRPDPTRPKNTVDKKDGYHQRNVRQFAIILRYILASPGRPCDNRSKCHIDEKRIQCLSSASQHVPIYLQPFPSNSTRKFKGSPFQHFLHILASAGYAPGTIVINVTWMERMKKMLVKRIAAYTHLSSNVYEL